MKLVILALLISPIAILTAPRPEAMPPRPVKLMGQLQPIEQVYDPVAPIITQKYIETPTEASTEPEMTPERCQQERNVDNIDFAMACKNAGVWWSDGKDNPTN